MPLFDLNNAESVEAKNLYFLADILSACESFQDLTETTNSTDAREFVTIGPQPDPWDNEEYTIEQLENEFFYCTVAPSDDEGHQAVRPETLTECPNEGGTLEVYLRRQVRQSEIQGAGKGDVYLYFLDRISALAHEIFEQAFDDKNMRIQTVSRDFSPSFGDIASAVAQGEYIWTNLMVEWGDLDLAGQS